MNGNNSNPNDADFNIDSALMQVDFKYNKQQLREFKQTIVSIDNAIKALVASYKLAENAQARGHITRRINKWKELRTQRFLEAKEFVASAIKQEASQKKLTSDAKERLKQIKDENATAIMARREQMANLKEKIKAIKDEEATSKMARQEKAAKDKQQKEEQKQWVKDAKLAAQQQEEREKQVIQRRKKIRHLLFGGGDDSSGGSGGGGGGWLLAPFKLLGKLIKMILTPFKTIGKILVTILAWPMKMAREMVNLGTTIITQGLEKFAAFTLETAKLEHTLLNLSDRTRITVQRFKEMGFAAEMTGSTAKAMQSTLENLMMKGLTLEHVRMRFSGLSPRQRLYAAQQLGVDVSLIPLIVSGEFEQLQQQFADIQRLSDQTADEMSQKFRAFQRQSITLSAIFNTLGRSIATKVLTKASPAIDDFISYAKANFKTIDKAISEAMISAGQAVYNFFTDTTVKSAITWFKDRIVEIGTKVKNWFTGTDNKFWEGSQAQEFYDKWSVKLEKLKTDLSEIYEKYLKPLWAGDEGDFSNSPLGKFIAGLQQAFSTMFGWLFNLMVKLGLIKPDVPFEVEDIPLDRKIREKLIFFNEDAYTAALETQKELEKQYGRGTLHQVKEDPNKFTWTGVKGSIVIDVSDLDDIKYYNASAGANPEDALNAGYGVGRSTVTEIPQYLGNLFETQLSNSLFKVFSKDNALGYEPQMSHGLMGGTVYNITYSPTITTLRDGSDVSVELYNEFKTRYNWR